MKQNQWIELVQHAIDNVVDASLRALLERIKTYGNIPRKEAKFVNFLQNSLRIRDVRLCNRAWTAIVEQTKLLSADSTESTASNDQRVERKRKLDEPQSTNDDDEKKMKKAFKWKSTIKKTLKDATQQQMTMKRLKKAVIAVYHEETSKVDDATSSIDIDAVFASKLASLGDQLQIDDHTKIVKLIVKDI